MLKSMATTCLSGSLVDKIEAIAGAGFQGIEIFEPDLTVSPLAPREIARLLAEHSLALTCFQPFRDFEGLRGPSRLRAFDRAEAKFDLMSELGAELMLVCSSVAPDSDGDMARIAADFHELGERAARRGLRIGYEALAWGRYIYDHRQAWEVVQRAAHPAVGIILDSFHSLARGVPIESIAGIPGERIFLVQVADAPGVAMDPLYRSRHFRCFPAQGDLPVAGYVAAIIAQGYRGPLSLEIFNDRFRSWAPGQIAEDGRRSLVLLEEQVAARGMPQSLAIDPPQAPGGTTFIEFAAGDEEADDLRRMFGAMGFGLAGRHRTKAVTHWRQNDTDLVLNEEPQGFAHAHATVHGASVCAFGIGVDDPAAVMRRAAALGMHAFDQPHAAGELAIPSLRGVGGSLIYFTPKLCDESFWQNDFAPLPHDAMGVGLQRVDHLAQSMPPEEFLSWQLYYLSLLEVDRNAPQDIADPLGLVQSQAIESRDGALRITLNGAAGRTLASRFVQNYFGAGVQHIAFSTLNIVRTVQMLRANGVELLSLPDNYYADLQARFGLDDRDVSQLSDNNLLYDRDDGGEYLQAYTRAHKRRFFFEIVERRRYAGYGAANAAARLAAQARFAPSGD